MVRWKWFQTRGKHIDPIGPATIYRERRGAYAPGGAPGESEPAWTARTAMLPTIRPPAPLMTPGQRSRASDPGSADR